ncbi:PREDICTED: general transcription factor 3C polypeptide 1 isoform X1 [Rhagoletis zephyria]|uniref:general transcription factor 3C polypeptide 1 isoform X1 n=1 Tax=Rhagoletis zephyria TaxID=28612 RepID=UPI000811A3E8|nr:PREDICTED: general transcription factor 3C polypeptide 1 isoform X1 [Rhagoletis zephyria]
MIRPIRRSPVSQIILEEIALEGLEGMTLSLLWAYLSLDLEAPIPLPSDVLNRVWDFIKRNTHQLDFYELPTERATFPLECRFSYEDPDFGVPRALDPEKFPRYKFVPIEDGKIQGSCEFYKERKRIEATEVNDLSAESVFERWGNRFVIVASQNLRLCVLTPRNKPIPRDFTVTQYCFWEAIGRSRYNGETTSGPQSLLTMCKDSSVLFYIKNKLIYYGLIVQQPFHEYRDDRLCNTALLNLSQYVPEIPRNITNLLEKIYTLVKEAPGEYLPLVQLRKAVPSFARKSAFRRLALTPFFQHIFELQKVGVGRKTNKGKDLNVLSITLKNSEKPVNELIADFLDEQKEDENNFSDAYVDNKHAFVDMTIKEEFYRAVLRHGASGCSHSELASYLSESHSIIRQMVKCMQREGLIVTHAVDEGRQRVYRFVALEVANAEKATKTENDSEPTAIIKFNELPSITQLEDTFTVDCPQIEATVEEDKYEDKQFRVIHTQRQQSRRDFIVRQLNEHAVLQMVIIRHRLYTFEKEQGLTDEICAKSMRRLLEELHKTDNLNIYKVVLKYQGHLRIYRYAAHPAVDANHMLIQREVKRLKNKLLIAREREEQKNRNRLRISRKVSKKPHKAVAEVKPTKMESTPEHMTNNNLPKPPKFLISRYMHEFLFYIVVELNEHQNMLEIDETLLQIWKESEPALQINQFLESLHAGGEVQHAYTQQISWRAFITPLPNYADKPAGWVYFLDAIDRMPLSIFNKIFRFQQTDGNMLGEYLTHPVRQHYLLRQLPVELQNQINRTYLQRICSLVLKLLNHMGLIQVNENTNFKDSMQIWVYLNRHAQIIDTTPSEASYAKVNLAQKYEKLDFYFSTFEDIAQYWNQLHRICIYTKLGVRSAKLQGKSERAKLLQFVRSVGFDEAPQYDNGDVPGDRAGAAGLAAQLFAHTMRGWSWVLHTNTKPKQIRSGRAALLRGASSKHLRLMGLRKTRMHASQITRLSHSATVKRTTKKKSASIRDATDCDALKNMRTLRACWTKDEDDLLKLARAVYIYIAAPVPVLGLMVVGKICRDVIRQHLGIRNKTSQACHRRMQYIMKKDRHIPEVPTWVHILQTSVEIHRRYGENFLQQLKNVYPQREEYSDALAVHFIQIFHYLYQMVNNIRGKGTSDAMRPRFMIPDTLDEFKRRFSMRSAATDERIMKYQNPCNEQEALTMLAVGVLHSSLCSALDKTTYTAQAFEIFKKFSEEILQNAFKIARNGALIVANKRRILEMLPSQLTSPAYSLSAHYQRRLLSLRIPYYIYDSLFGFFENVVAVLMKPKREPIEQPSTSKRLSISNIVELKSPNAGQLYFLAEGMARSFWTCNVKLPINILTVDAEQRQTLSAMDRILDHYHCIFDNAPKTEYTKSFESEANEKQVRVKFQPANLSYKITYSPYDFISKLPVRHLHFFCALDHLNHEVEINFSRLMHKDEEHDTLSIECPFNCILKHANYINVIERIVQEKRSILRELTEMPPQKLLNMAMSGCSVTVESTNLLTLVRMLESFWREKETAYERKDLGRISANVKINKSIDWHQLCCEILEFNAADEENDKIDEYEPTLNKEERLARAQDVFVVNLPTLQLEVNKKLHLCNKETVMHSGLCVPKRLVEAEVIRDQILRKIVDESHWKYTDNTFEVLKPKLIKLGFTAMEQQHVEDLLKYIETHKLGVSVIDLKREFPYAQFLSRAIRILSEHYLVKRVGIDTMMYVHKSHIRPWVVHTFHLKRLEREKLGPDGTLTLKRKITSGDCSENENMDEEGSDEPEEASSSKRAKLANDVGATAEDQQLSKRVSKPVNRFQGENREGNAPEKDLKRDVIVMKPHPWIRLNGTINRRVLDRWLGSVLTECVSRSGCMIPDICSKFPHLPAVEIMFLLDILCDLQCIHLTEITPASANLFSSYDNLQETIVTEFYDPQHTYVTAHGDAITRMSIFIGHKKYSQQFY